MSSTLQKISQLQQKPDTKQVLTDLFQENTGRHMLDSGGAYGRNWEENNDMEDLEEEKPVLELDLWKDEDRLEIIPSVSTFHVMLEQTEYTDQAHKLTKMFYEDAQTGDTSRSWLTEMTEWIENNNRDGKEAHAVNTYNHEFNHADQVLQFIPFTVHAVDEENEVLEIEYDIYGDHMLVQVHGGCDVRGGYTAPIVLETYEATRFMRVGDWLELVDQDGNHLFEGVEHEMNPDIDEIDEVTWNSDREALEDSQGRLVKARCGIGETEVVK